MALHSTSVVLVPHLFLKDVVESYTFREIFLDKGEKLQKIMPHRLATSIDFYLGNPHKTIKTATQEKGNFFQSEIRGYRTFSKYSIEIENHFISVSIKFRLGGIYKMFGIPMCQLTDQDFELDLLNILPAKEIHEKLTEANSPFEIKLLLDFYLMNVEQKKNKLIFLDQISEDTIPNQAQNAGKSLRQWERIFKDQTGLSPKSFQNLKRFNSLILSKQQNPTMNWTTLGYEAGYFDQSHFIKDFKKYLNILPKTFDSNNFAF